MHQEVCSCLVLLGLPAARKHRPELLPPTCVGRGKWQNLWYHQQRTEFGQHQWKRNIFDASTVACGNDMASFGAAFYQGSCYVQNLTKTGTKFWGMCSSPVFHLQILFLGLSLSLKRSVLHDLAVSSLSCVCVLLFILSLISSTSCSFNPHLFAVDPQIFPGSRQFS